MAGTENIAYSENVLHFVAAANEYCTLLEDIDQYNYSSFIEKAHIILPNLYSKAARLPVVISESDEVNEKYVSEDDYNNLSKKISIFFKQLKNNKNINNSVIANLAENLTDIYQDIKDFLMIYRSRQDNLVREAIWECQHNFKEYWGIKLIRSLPVIHALKYNLLPVIPTAESDLFTKTTGEKKESFRNDFNTNSLTSEKSREEF